MQEDLDSLLNAITPSMGAGPGSLRKTVSSQNYIASLSRCPSLPKQMVRRLSQEPSYRWIFNCMGDIAVVLDGTTTMEALGYIQTFFPSTYDEFLDHWGMEELADVVALYLSAYGKV